MAFRTRLKVMDDFDDAMLSFALVDAYPHVVFEDTHAATQTERFVRRASIPECTGTVTEVHFVPQAWQPDFVFPPGTGGPYSGRLMNPPQFTLHYVRCEWFWGAPQGGNWAFDLPTLESNQMSMNYDRESKEDRAFVAKLWRLFDRLMTNRLKHPLWPKPFMQADAKGGDFWAGHHALEWCLGGDRRMLMGHSIPCDDWAPPDSDWHEDLRRRVVERFGPGISDPTAG